MKQKETSVEVEILSAVLYERENENDIQVGTHELMMNPYWKSFYLVGLKVDGKEAHLQLGKEPWPRKQ